MAFKQALIMFCSKLHGYPEIVFLAVNVEWNEQELFVFLKYVGRVNSPFPSCLSESL